MLSKLIVGLGNPEQERYYTRHNISWYYIDFMEKAFVKTIFNESGIAEYFNREIYSDVLNSECNIVFAKPLTGMNDSGKAVKWLMNQYDITAPENVLIILDELELPFGQIRLRNKGKTHHNGLKSVLSETGLSNIAHLRIGLGAKPKDMDVLSYVLSNFGADELKSLQDGVYPKVRLAIENWIRYSFDKAMSIINNRNF